jgi:hypothetical protein
MPEGTNCHSEVRVILMKLPRVSSVSREGGRGGRPPVLVLIRGEKELRVNTGKCRISERVGWMWRKRDGRGIMTLKLKHRTRV